MNESDIKKGVKTRIVTGPQFKEIGPKKEHDCFLCKAPIFDKDPCALLDVKGVKKVICLKCKEKSDQEKK